MNRKGFTLVELLAALVALGLVLGIGTFSISNVVSRSKVKSEEAFVEFIKDALDVYIDNPTYMVESGSEKFEKLEYTACENNSDYEYAYIPMFNDDGSVIENDVTFDNIVNSPYYPITKNELVNPVNDRNCVPEGGLESIIVKIYRNKNRSYYYKVEKTSLNGCFEFTVNDTDAKDKVNYVSNMKDPGNFICS